MAAGGAAGRGRTDEDSQQSAPMKSDAVISAPPVGSTVPFATCFSSPPPRESLRVGRPRHSNIFDVSPLKAAPPTGISPFISPPGGGSSDDTVAVPPCRSGTGRSQRLPPPSQLLLKKVKEVKGHRQTPGNMPGTRWHQRPPVAHSSFHHVATRGH